MADQHLYQNVNVQVEEVAGSNQSPELQPVDQNQDQQPANQDQEQLVANQNEPMVGQNELQAAIQNPQAQQPANQNEALQQAEAANGNADQQPNAEKPKIPYGIVTIHSDQSKTTDNNYAEVRNEGTEDVQDLTYDRVNDDSEITENGYSTVVRDQPTQQRPQRDRMYESVDEAFEREPKPR